MGDITGIILNNIKGEALAQANQGSGGIRQIKHLGSNPGSRVGSQKAAQRIGDQTTCIKKGANEAHANPEKFVGSIFKQAPKIGGVGIRVNKEGSQGRRPVMQHAGSGTRVQPSTFGSGSGSHGFIKAPSGLNGKSRKNGSCNAVVQRNPKGQVQIHGSLDHEPQTKIPTSSRNTSELRLTT